MASAASTARVSQAELARRLGVSRQAIGDLVERGIIERGDDGLIDVELARYAIEHRVRPSGKTAASLDAKTQATPAQEAKPDTEQAITSYHVAKTLREAAEARISQLKLAEMQGDLMRRDDVMRAFFDAARGLRDAMVNSSRRMAAEVAAVTEPAECERIVAKEHRHLLDSFVKTISDTFAAPPPLDHASAPPDPATVATEVRA